MKIVLKHPQDHINNNTNVYQIDGTWSLDILNLNDYGQEIDRGY